MDIKSHRLKINYIFVNNKNEQKSTLDGQNTTLQMDTLIFIFYLILTP